MAAMWYVLQGEQMREAFLDIVRIYGDEGTPVPIPNTEVKLTRAEDTCLETNRENR